MKTTRKTTDEATSPVVTILQKNLNLYRVPFYELLRTELAASGIGLRLVAGGGLAEDMAKQDSGELDWAEHRAFRELKIKGKTLLWQPGFDLARQSDLLIAEQASKQLFNIFLAYGQGLLGTKFAFWGHGKNFQASREGNSGEGLKQQLTRKAHWFFSYNDLSSQAAIDAGMAADRITPVMNSTDTRHMRAFAETVDGDAVRSELGLGDGPIGLFMGGLYPYKRPEFLLKAALEIRRRLPDFELIVIGDGSLGRHVEEAANKHDWIHWLGAMYGDSRIGPASVCAIQLMPGLVGLNVVDGFALGLPTITIEDDFHSPEIEYLLHDVNGLVLPPGSSVEKYAIAAVEILKDKDRLKTLQDQAYQSSFTLSTEDMVSRFVDGIHHALAAPSR